MVRNPDHVCKPFTHEEYVALNDKSSTMWKRRTGGQRLVQGNQYDLEDYNNWVDKDNPGISYFGIDPNHLRLDNLRFDVFHLTCAITKHVLLALKKNRTVL